MQNKYFNIAGPCIASSHYMIDAQRRLMEVHPLIEQAQYFVIYAARQSGKTTLLLDLVNSLNKSGKYYTLYCSLEVVQGIDEAEQGIFIIINALKAALEFSGIPGTEVFAEKVDRNDFSNALKVELSRFCQKLSKPLVIFFDEADCLRNSTLISFLQQVRNGYNTRSISPFVHSIALVGMRNIRDFKAQIRPEPETLGSASPFNIISEALTLRNFTKEEIIELYGQHLTESGQKFEPLAIELIWEQTSGQPWLVNAIAREIIVKILNGNNSLTITPPMVEQAIQNIILRRDTHIDSLLERLKEPRVRKVIEPVILGKSQGINISEDDTRYCLDLGLIKALNGELLPSNKIYNEVIIRTLSYDTQFNLESQIQNTWIKNGIIDLNGLLKGFQQFWRENSNIWAEKYEYKEAAPHLILQAFLQRIINGGGSISREYASGRNRMDLCVNYQNHKYPIELKIMYDKSVTDKGIEQLGNYMDSLGENKGWLVIFDRNNTKSWDEKIYWNTVDYNSKTIHVVGC